MSSITIVAIALLSAIVVLSQSENSTPEFNFGFEKVSDKEKLPDTWYQFGSGYSLKIDSTEKKSGNSSILIEPMPNRLLGSFGSIATTFPSYEGKEIELKGFLKYKDVTNGFVGLWIRIEGEGGVLQFDNMQTQGLMGSADWKEYSIKLPLPEDANKITIGALLTGDGQLWADDFHVLIDGKDISEAKVRQPVIYKASKDKEFDNGSRIEAGKLRASKIDDLVVLGKVWGFLKYYHPAIARGDYNWDYELFRILPKILQAKDRRERNGVLASWVDMLGGIEADAAKPLPAKIKLAPDLVWINEKTLGTKLAAKLYFVRDARRLENNYYVGLVSDVGNPQFKNEVGYRSMRYPDAGFRLLSLYRYWNIVEYYNPNKNLIGENWNKVLAEFIPKFVDAAGELEYKKAALALIGRINDTHANIWGKDETLEKFRGLNSAPIGVTFIEDQVVVTTIWDQTLADRSGLRLGDVIKTINGRNVSDIVKERLDLSPASNYSTKLRDISIALLRTTESFLQIKYERSGVTGDAQLECFPPDKLTIDRGELFAKKIPPFKLIGSDIGYLYPGSLKPGEVQKIMPEIAKTKGLIIDLRSYPSDFIVYSLGEFLMPKPTSFVKFSVGSISKPGLFTLSEDLQVGKENNDYYKGKVIILVNEITQSQAEYTAMAFQRAPRAVVVGSTTAGADGNVSQFFLPGGISTMISGIGIYYPDGRDTQRVGIIPDVVLKPTIKGIRERRDEILEKAIALINSP
ncbi:MAG: S41 family peptidase [Acidobacteriota bacterium]